MTNKRLLYINDTLPVRNGIRWLTMAVFIDCGKQNGLAGSDKRPAKRAIVDNIRRHAAEPQNPFPSSIR